MTRNALLSSSSTPAGAQVAFGAIAVAAVTAVAQRLFGRERPEDVVMLYLLVTVLVSMRARFWPSIVTVAFSVLAFDVFFVPPYFSLAVSDLKHVGTFAIMFAVATIINHQTRRLREQVELAEEREHQMRALDAQTQAARTEMLREQLRSTLLSSVSHDLRTPLATVIGAASALLSGNSIPEPDRKELLHSILEEAERLERLVRNLLAMTRLEGGPVAMRRELQPLDGIVGAVLERLGPRAGERAITTELPPDLAPVEVDGMLIEQLITNLFENALAHAPAGTAIEIRASAAGSNVRVEVVDHGPGVPAEHRERIFEKFHRVKRSGGGVGLGLAICRGIVEAHGGTIHVEEVEGGGARFVFTLPAGSPPPGSAA